MFESKNLKVWETAYLVEANTSTLQGLSAGIEEAGHDKDEMIRGLLVRTKNGCFT